jgi:hypothetical protein
MATAHRHVDPDPDAQARRADLRSAAASERADPESLTWALEARESLKIAFSDGSIWGKIAEGER